jgi:hypothetical protein
MPRDPYYLVCVTLVQFCGFSDAGDGVTRWRRPGADEILRVYVLLAAIGFAWNWLSHGFGPRESLPWFLITAFLAWRVSRGGRISRAILILASGAFYVVAVLHVARLWDLSVIALVIIAAAQVGLLLSPPVLGRTTRWPAPVPARAEGWTQLARRPPAWLLPWGLLAGVLLTLACLGSMDFTLIAGCRPAASGACTPLAEGYPLRWLTSHHNDPLISKGALLRDCAQWALACTSVLYLAWHWLTAPGGLPD